MNFTYIDMGQKVAIGCLSKLVQNPQESCLFVLENILRLSLCKHFHLHTLSSHVWPLK